MVALIIMGWSLAYYQWYAVCTYLEILSGPCHTPHFSPCTPPCPSRYHEIRRLLCCTSEDIISGDEAEENKKNEGNDSVSAALARSLCSVQLYEERRKDINKAPIDVATDSPGFFTPAWIH